MIDLTDFYNGYTLIFMTIFLMAVSIVPLSLGATIIAFLLSGEIISSVFKSSNEHKL